MNSQTVSYEHDYLLCEKSGAILLAASGSYSRQAGRQSDEILVEKFPTD